MGGTNGFKRIRKIINGNSIVLEQKQDGGYLQDIWYRVFIQVDFIFNYDLII